MKKVICCILMLCMVLSALPALAASGAESVLVSVKNKIDIPEDLTEFNYSENKYDDVLRYDFLWTDKDGTKEIYASSDALGRLVSYSYYDGNEIRDGRVLIKYTEDDGKALAEDFVRKAFCEYFENDLKDRLVLDESRTQHSYSGWQKRFTFYFDRVYDGVKVESNNVVVRVRALKDKMYVQSVTASLDTDCEFEETKPLFENSEREAKYEEKYPIELYYASDYSDGERKVRLFYKIEKGYVSYSTGEVVEREYFDRYAVTEDSMMNSMAGGAKKDDAGITVQEKAELDKMANLVKIEEIAKRLRGMKLLKFTDDLKLEKEYTYKRGEEYFINASFESELRYLSVTYNGQDGEIISISSYFKEYEDKKDIPEVTDKLKADMEAMVRELSGKRLDETKYEFEARDKRVSLKADRVVDGVLYYENGIYITYDLLMGIVTNYSIEWEKDVSSFQKTEEAMDVDKARQIVFEKGKSEDVFVKTKEGYTKAVTIGQGITIFADNGKSLYEQNEKADEYIDIAGHWAENEIQVLREHDIYIEGDKFTPDEPIRNADMLRLFSACRESGVYPIRYDDKMICDASIAEGYTENADADKLVSREEAFDVLCEIIGYGDIAKLDIFKAGFEDSDDFEHIGSAEILRGLGIIKGEKARAKAYLTYAEAAAMVYRFLAK